MTPTPTIISSPSPLRPTSSAAVAAAKARSLTSVSCPTQSTNPSCRGSTRRAGTSSPRVAPPLQWTQKPICHRDSGCLWEQRQQQRPPPSREDAQPRYRASVGTVLTVPIRTRPVTIRTAIQSIALTRFAPLIIRQKGVAVAVRSAKRASASTRQKAKSGRQNSSSTDLVKS